MFKKLACFTGWLVVLGLSLVFCFIFGLWQNWDTPAIILFWLLMLLLVLLLWAGLYGVMQVFGGKKSLGLLKKYRLSRREYVLLSHWRAGANILRQLRRKRTHLPWYVMVGERCGKSTLLASSGVPRFYGVTDDSVISPTRTLNWWFFRRLCVLELSSNFLNGTTAFRQTWGKVAVWLTRMSAPAGIIIALPVTVLIEGNPGSLHEAARRQRALIEPLMNRFGERLPLYIMVTECDRLPGFSLWQQQLSVRQKQQTLGYTWTTPPHIDGQDEHTLHPLFAVLKQGFSRVRLSMARPEELSKQEYVTLLELPEAFCGLESPLRSFLSSLCEPNAYFSHSTLRSVWFSATEFQAENRKRCISYFVHDLLTGHLWDLNRGRDNHRWYLRRRGKICCMLLLTTCMLWASISAILTSARLQPDVSRMQSDALAEFMAADEQYSSARLRYLPFLPLLQKQYALAESRLVQVVKDTPRPLQQTLANYQQQVLSASPAHQRDYILLLADAIQVWRHMRDGASLRELQQLPSVTASLQQRQYPETLSPLTLLVLERYHMERLGGERWLQSVQQLLINLVNHDPSMTWLLSDTEKLPAQQAGSFWSLMPETIALSGIWSRQGEIAVEEWMSRIERAAGQPIPTFQHFRNSWPVRRQVAWRQYLIEVSAVLSSATHTSMTKAQLIALGQNNSPSTRFVENIINELSSVRESQTDDWLITLRNIYQLSMKNKASAVMSHAQLVNTQIRQSLTAWLQGKQGVHSSSVLTEPAVRLWDNWLKARNLAVKEALILEASSPQLTRGMFSESSKPSERNPLLDLLPALVSLQERLSPDSHDVGVAAIWLLYQNDARQLLANAMAQSACWLNEQWKSRVIWPLDNNAGLRSYEEQQTLALQYISEFMRGPAKVLLVTDKNGPAAASYAGIKAPLTDDFLLFTRQSFPQEIIQDVPERASTRDSEQRTALQAKLTELEQQQSELEKQNWTVSLSSMPATIPGGAKMMPVGVRLTLKCQKGDQILDSLNFAEHTEFSWQAGQCRDVWLDVKFPYFSVTYNGRGDSSWPDFVRRFTSGEAMFDNSDFGKDAALLNNLGIKHILVRFAVSGDQPLNDAWQNWRDRAEKIDAFRTQLAELDERIQRQQSEIAQANPLSALPNNSAQCL